ncbi:sulfite exporter TauE/SafE family protein [Aurantiacibacter xanthus]|uniref:Probable membrane transporter protein n=1 Tax=Aurantiacibacter xanthus TaxID=1784712 RepID=A0A3A1NZD6_9SPHN|nr:sulfite exporter TauE/SafE family protein [Aurantiacibacter xanthus]RIV80613.1 sulfite exporter TauE/SafE family protein [Aurantiacibacter xanthus]
MLTHIDLGYSAAGAFVSFLIGLTGVGGGSLMAPILIVLLGVPPAMAVGTDLWFAAITKSVGGATHHKLRSVDWQVVRQLAKGSVPAAIVTLVWLWLFEGGSLDAKPLMRLLGAALLLTSLMMILKPRIQPALVSMASRMGTTMRAQQGLVVTCGAVGIGALVALTSVGAGALVAVLLATVYPLRLGTRTIVGTDIVHAVPLTLVAGMGHSFLGNVDGWMLASLLLGSIPGIVAGSLVSGKVKEDYVRYALAAMLVVSSLKMLTS